VIRELARLAAHETPPWVRGIGIAVAAAVGCYVATYEFWVTAEQHRTLFHRLFPR
jgi:hypothetical protein